MVQGAEAAQRGFYVEDSTDSRVLHLSQTYDPELHGFRWAAALVEDLPQATRRVVIDLGGFDRVDSRLFTGLLQANRGLAQLGVREVSLRAVGPRVRAGLDVLRLSPMFRIENMRIPTGRLVSAPGGAVHDQRSDQHLRNPTPRLIITGSCSADNDP